MPVLSPDGKNVLYASVRGVPARGAARGPWTLVVKSLETQAEKSFSTDVELGARPVWFPDGRSLLVAARGFPQSLPGSTGFYKVDVESGRFTSIAGARNGIRPNQVALSWSPASDDVAVTGYAVYRDGVAIATTTANNFTDTTVLSDSSYSYTVRSYDAAGNTAMRDLAAAEYFYLQGNRSQAAYKAEAASRALPRGTPAWLRAQDLKAAIQADRPRR